MGDKKLIESIEKTRWKFYQLTKKVLNKRQFYDKTSNKFTTRSLCFFMLVLWA